MRRNVSFNLTRLGMLALLGGLTLLSPAPAYAQDDVTISMARERFKEGVAYFDKKDFPKARVAFLQAYALKKHPAVLLNLAQSELRSGHEADAAKHFAQYLREHKEATESERQGAETGLAASKALVAEVNLDVDTPGAEIYIDGDLEGLAPLPGAIYLEPGSHNIQAKKDSLGASKLINAGAAQSSNMSLKLTAAGKTAPPAPAAAPPADGAPPAPPPSGEASPPPEQPAAEPAEQRASQQSFFRKPGAIVGVSLVGLGLVSAGAFALGSKSAYNAADSIASQIGDHAVNLDGKESRSGACNNPAGWLAVSSVWAGRSAEDRAARAAEYDANCAKYKDNVKSGDTYKTLAYVSVGVAAAAGIGTVIYYVATKDSGSQASRGGRRVMVIPVYEPGFSGGVLSGSF